MASPLKNPLTRLMYKSLLKKKLLTALNRHATAYMNITTSLYRKRAMQDISFGIRQSISKGLAKPGVLLFFVVQPYIPAFLLSIIWRRESIFSLTFLIDMGGKMLQEFGRICLADKKSVIYAFANAFTLCPSQILLASRT